MSQNSLLISQFVWRCISLVLLVRVGIGMRLNVDRIVVDRSSRKDKSVAFGSSLAHGTHVRAHDRDAARKMSGNHTNSDDSKRASHRTLLSRSSVGAFSRRSWLEYLSRYNTDYTSHDLTGKSSTPRKDFWSLLSLATTSSDNGRLSQESWHHRLRASMHEGLSYLFGNRKPASFMERNSGWVLALCAGFLVCWCSSIALNNQQELDSAVGDGDGYSSSGGIERQGSIGKRVKGTAKQTYSRSRGFTAGIKDKLMGRKKEDKPEKEKGAKCKAKTSYSSRNASSDGNHGDVDSSSDSDNEPALQASYDDDDSPATSKAKNWRARLGLAKDSQSN